MQHKKIITLTLLLFILITSLFAIGAGIQVGGNPGLFINEENVKLEKFSGTLTGTMRLSRIPLAFGCGFEAGSYFSNFSFGFTGFADYYALDLQLRNSWNLFSGFGAKGSLLTTDFKEWTPAAGGRFFIGVNRLFYDNYLEVFAQQTIEPTYIKGSFMLNLPLEAGIRMHF